MEPITDTKLLLMPKPLSAEQSGVAEAETPPDPEISNSPLAFSGPLTRDTMSEYTESQLIRNAKRVVPRAFKTLNKLIDQGDRKALEMAFAIYNYTGKSGVTIVNNVLQQNSYGGGNGGRDQQQEVYFESILRKIEKEEKDNRREIIDVEPE